MSLTGKRKDGHTDRQEDIHLKFNKVRIEFSLTNVLEQDI